MRLATQAVVEMTDRATAVLDLGRKRELGAPPRRADLMNTGEVLPERPLSLSIRAL
jgi:hypothetical protein